MMGDPIPSRDGLKFMWMETFPGHRIYCDDHKPPRSYQIEVSLGSNCWQCLRTKPKKTEKNYARNPTGKAGRVPGEMSFNTLVQWFMDVCIGRNWVFPIDGEAFL